jgi:hypothetical protein
MTEPNEIVVDVPVNETRYIQYSDGTTELYRNDVLIIKTQADGSVLCSGGLVATWLGYLPEPGEPKG